MKKLYITLSLTALMAALLLIPSLALAETVLADVGVALPATGYD